LTLIKKIIRLNKSINHLILKILLSPLKGLLSHSSRGLVLATHGVTNDLINSPIEQVHIKNKNFTGVIELLKDLDFDFISMDELLSISRNGFKYKRHWVHLTFDDGYSNICNGTLQWLIEREIPFSIFVSTHHIETGIQFPTFFARYAHSLNKDLAKIYSIKSVTNFEEAEARLKFSDCLTHEELLKKIFTSLSESERREIDSFKNELPLNLQLLSWIAEQQGVHIGSHMHHHWLFHDNQNIELMAADLKISLNKLKKEWAINKSPGFCYPNGNYNASAVDILRGLGIDIAFTSQSGFVDSRTECLLMPRFAITSRLRMLGICILCTLGNRSLRIFRRYPPKLN
jgi:peptidoglycan/xylan/chitin deacetylase (PgdA/CDA1 family)